jgi:hypothetical protein
MSEPLQNDIPDGMEIVKKTMPDFENCPLGIRHESELRDFQRRISIMEIAIVDIRDKLLGRPSWMVTLMLTTMFGISSSLAVYILTHP